MENYIYLKVPDYLAHFLKERFGDPCVIAKDSSSLNIIRQSGSNQTGGRAMSDNFNIRILIPGLRPQIRYVGKKGNILLQKRYHSLFKQTLMAEISAFIANNTISESIYCFMEKYGISFEEKNWLAISQIYYRIRKRSKK